MLVEKVSKKQNEDYRMRHLNVWATITTAKKKLRHVGILYTTQGARSYEREEAGEVGRRK